MSASDLIIGGLVLLLIFVALSSLKVKYVDPYARRLAFRRARIGRR